MEKSSARQWDWLSAVLLLLILQAAAARLVTTDWAPFLYFAETLATFGSVLGMALGASRYKRRVVIWFVIDYTLAVLPWQMTGAVDKSLPFAERFLNIGGVLLTSLNQFLQRKNVEDSFFFVAFVSLAFWIIALSAGYWIMRHRNVLAAVIPAGVAIFVIQAYDDFQGRGSWWIAVFILLTLLLLGRTYYLNNRREWQKRRLFVNDEAWANIFGGLFASAALAVALAWLTPASLQNLQAASDAWSQFTKPVRERLSNAVSPLEAPFGAGGSNFYGETLGLGRNAAIGDSPVFTVEALSAPNVPRYYWRGRVYDFYSNGQWISTPASRFDFDPDSADLNIPNADNRSTAILQFTYQFQTQTLIYAPSQPVWIDKPSVISATRLETSANDVLAWEAKTSIQTGARYQVRARIASPSVEQLRAASVEYPEWVTARYLEVPDNIRPDFETLARKITAGQNNPYDKATAVTAYLRANMQYSTSLPATPEGREPLAWILFTYKKGFCNQYASSEVILLRSLGIPARLAVGFAQGESTNGGYLVRKRDAHAWPEVYFPGIGWVEFEPTVIQDPLVRPETIQNNGANGAAVSPRTRPDEAGKLTPTTDSEKNTSQSGQPFVQTIFGRALIVLLTMLATAMAVFLLYRYRVFTFMPLYVSRALERGGIPSPSWIENWWRWNQLEPVERSFSAMDVSLRWLGKPQPMDSTPAERAARLKKLLPSAAKHIEVLESELESGLFTPRPANLSRARRAGFFILLYAMRERIYSLLGVNNARDVYSG